MADIRALLDKALDMAKLASPLIPVLGTGAAIGEKIIDLIDSFGEDIPIDKQAEAQAARAELAAKVRAKAQDTSSRLRGE